MTKSAKIYSCIVVFLLVESVLYFFVDRYVALYFSVAEITGPHFVDFFRNITDLGLGKWYLVPFGIGTLFCAFLSRGKDVLLRYRLLFGYVGVRTLFLFTTIAISGIVADIIKPIIGRARPGLWLHNALYGFAPWTFDSHWNGMPSGHTTTAFALAGTLSILYPRMRILWFAYALMLGASRVIVDAHYVSDVCAGAVLGALTVHVVHKHMIVRISKVIFPIDSAVSAK